MMMPLLSWQSSQTFTDKHYLTNSIHQFLIRYCLLVICLCSHPNSISMTWIIDMLLLHIVTFWYFSLYSYTYLLTYSYCYTFAHPIHGVRGIVFLLSIRLCMSACLGWGILLAGCCWLVVASVTVLDSSQCFYSDVFSVFVSGCRSALKDMSASERHFSSIQELMKNAVFMKQQIHYETLRRCLHASLCRSTCTCICAWLPWPFSLTSSVCFVFAAAGSFSFSLLCS